MGPILIVLISSIATSYGDVYQLPPPGYLPPNHKYSDGQTSNQQHTQLATVDTSHHYEPYATMEIFKERNQRHLEEPNYHIVPDNHKPIHVEVYKVPDNHKQTEEGQLGGQEAQPTSAISRGSDLQSALEGLDFFNEGKAPFRGGAVPTASAEYATAFPQDEVEREIVGRPSRYYPVQQNQFTPTSSYFTPNYGHSANLKQLEDIVEKPKKLKPKKKYSSKLQKFPKKYKNSPKKNKLRVKSVSELDDYSLSSGSFNSPLQATPGISATLSSQLDIKPVDVEEFSIDTSKDKRRIPLSYYKARDGAQDDGFGAQLNSYNSFPSQQGNTHEGFSVPSGGSPDGDRVQFQMHGMDGPDSYKFGYDTGKGHNRHFRYEERDGHGRVKGHYGFYDQEGKMSMMHYEADPHTGFHAGPYHHPENHHEYN